MTRVLQRRYGWRYGRAMVKLPPGTDFSKLNVCGVLAGAYRGGRKALLTHYEAPGTNDAVCGTIKEGSLCDLNVGEAPTCPRCVQIAAAAAKRAV